MRAYGEPMLRTLLALTLVLAGCSSPGIRMTVLNSPPEPAKPMAHPPVASTIFYAELPVTDIGAAKSFFTGVFGWEWQDWGPTYADTQNAGLGCGLSESAEAPPLGVLVVLWSDDLEQTEASVIEHGGKITVPIFDFPGGRRFQFLAPGGVELAVCTGAED